MGMRLRRAGPIARVSGILHWHTAPPLPTTQHCHNPHLPHCRTHCTHCHTAKLHTAHTVTLHTLSHCIHCHTAHTVTLHTLSHCTPHRTAHIGTLPHSTQRQSATPHAMYSRLRVGCAQLALAAHLTWIGTSIHVSPAALLARPRTCPTTAPPAQATILYV